MMMIPPQAEEQKRMRYDHISILYDSFGILFSVT